MEEILPVSPFIRRKENAGKKKQYEKYLTPPGEKDLWVLSKVGIL